MQTSRKKTNKTRSEETRIKGPLGRGRTNVDAESEGNMASDPQVNAGNWMRYI
jgi:hypothetical protein